MLAEHAWPGNVRELQNCMERAAILCDGPVVEPERPAARPADARRPRPGRRHGPAGPLAEVGKRAAAAAEAEAIALALREAGGDRAAAAGAWGSACRP